MPETEQRSNETIVGVLEQLGSLADDKSAPVGGRPPAGSSNRRRVSSLLRDEEISARVDAGETGFDGAGADNGAFFPTAPRSLQDVGISEGEIEGIILKLLTTHATATGREIAKLIGLPFPITERLLYSLKAERLIVFKDTSTANDYVYHLTEAGLKAGRELRKDCNYCGTVPVPLAQYVASVAAQSLQRNQPQLDDLRRSLADLTFGEDMYLRLSRAVIAARGLFLYGRPGNGKTSIAERICAAYGATIWIPRAVSVLGEVIRVYDPSCHEAIVPVRGEQLVQQETTDLRWVRIRRPTIVVGGELTLESLEIKSDRDTGICEAPVQMKSNCGVLVIDDFGRQRISPTELLNRWIVPLEKRVDYLSLPSGRKIAVPFDQFPVFATNLQPKDLVDEAFLRRIPYKINVENPTREEFRSLCQQACKRVGVAYDESALEHLLAEHYEATGRELRFCHARDLVQQVAIYCKALLQPPAMTRVALDAVAQDYFSMV